MTMVAKKLIPLNEVIPVAAVVLSTWNSSAMGVMRVLKPVENPDTANRSRTRKIRLTQDCLPSFAESSFLVGVVGSGTLI